METTFKIAKNILLDSNGLSELHLEKVLSKTLNTGIEYVNIYLQYIQRESWYLEESTIKKGSFSIDQGVGITGIRGESIGFAYSDDITFSTMINAAKFANSIASSTESKQSHYIHPIESSSPKNILYPNINPLCSSDENKISLLKKLDLIARSIDPCVTHVQAHLSGSYDVIIINSSDGVLIADIRPLVHLTVTVLVEKNGRKEYGSYGGGRRSSYDIFIKENLASKYANEAVRMALTNLEAIPAPAGIMPVVLGHGWPAIMIHEAVGHGLEADFNRKGVSIYSDKIGEKVAASGISIVDQGNYPDGRRGTINVDDEGTPTQRTVLIENGILCNYLYDKLNAKLMHTQSTGNGRRSSYAQLPIPRMTNTFLLAGNSDPLDIISSVDDGLYAVNFSGGQVDITSGEFVFSTSEAYLIKKGKLICPVKNATLIGNGPEVLKKIEMIGNDLELDNGIGMCGKNGQNVPVGVGQPTLKISQLIVGGTNIKE